MITREAIDYTRFAVPGDSAQVSRLMIVNDAGELLCQAWPWRWLMRPPVSINLVAGQDHLDLPVGMVAPVWPIKGRDYDKEVRPTNLGNIFSMRQQPEYDPVWGYYGAVLFDGSASPRLEIYPTPGANFTDAFQVAGRYSWTRVSSDDDQIVMPPWLEPLFRVYLREVAGGIIRDRDETQDARIERVRSSRMFRDATLIDGGHQTSFGQISGGAVAVEHARDLEWSPEYNTPLDPP